MTENPEPEEDEAQQAQQAGEAEEPEVVAHGDTSADLPWCIGFMG